MATLAQLQDHIKKAKSNLAETEKKSENPKNDLDVRKKSKKVKRLSRKAAKIVFKEKMAAEKKKSKKEKKSAS